MAISVILLLHYILQAIKTFVSLCILAYGEYFLDIKPKVESSKDKTCLVLTSKKHIQCIIIVYEYQW